MSVFRCYSQKRPGFDVEAQGLCRQLREQLGVAALKRVDILNRYDADHIDPAVYEQAKGIVFSEPQVDSIYDEQFPVPAAPHTLLAVEALPGQFDQRADSCAQCIQLMAGVDRPLIAFARVFLFGAKAAPGYYVAKEIIHLINSLADTINADPVCKDKLQVVFLENYRVSLAERLMPASELSEQISTAGKEASGTGNMKFMMNGALTIGTLDGANVEMHQQVGDDNIFLFGLTADEVEEKKRAGYQAYEYYNNNPALKAVIDQIARGFGDGVAYDSLTNRLLFGGDEYMLLADFESYRQAQERAGLTYTDRTLWNQMALTNIARSGIFAADRSIRDYAKDIWHVPTRK